VGLMVVVDLASLEPVIQDTQSVISKFLAHEVSTIGGIAYWHCPGISFHGRGYNGQLL
jgi:hypothetical protein